VSFEDEMAQYDEQWEEDKERPTPGQLPDGKYQAAVNECRIEKDDDGTYTWYIKFQNQEGAVRKWTNLDHEVGRSVAAKDAKIMGFEGKLSGLNAACEEGLFNDLICEIVVKTKPGNERDFTNVYINRVLGKGDPNDFEPAAVEAGAGTSATDDDIPF